MRRINTVFNNALIKIMTTFAYFSFIQAYVCDASHTTNSKLFLGIAKLFKVKLNTVTGRVFKVNLLNAVHQSARAESY